ncbi:MAG: flippase-like domain-containing protein [Melioribacteraceae bacterium]|nr:flippase-like domain-containing protein [Melioribacteraceae bacterium]MCF8395102.1 flippase-like domain-containing protein [Melioribacteraceae bacterium]MCF8420511.1 flippase-like domain-containing protein [Melioribacteraceae bacterium]
MIQKLKKNILISLAAAAVIYIGFTIYADFNSVLNSFSQFTLFLLPILLLLSYLNYYSRFLKWHYYIKLLKIPLKFRDSYSIFMSGLVMSVTPGKMGELLKAFLVKQITQEPVSKTAPIILAERITDFISLIILALVGAYVFDQGKVIVIGTGIFFILLIVVISQKKWALKLISLLENIKFLKKYIVKVHQMYESSYKMLQPKPLILMTILSFASWFFECYGFYLILNDFALNVSLIWATFVYSFSTIIGAITMLPGGLGVTDGSLTLLIQQGGASTEVAVASTFLVRAVTLWFAVIVGAVSILFYQRRFGKIIVEQSDLNEKI